MYNSILDMEGYIMSEGLTRQARLILRRQAEYFTGKRCYMCHTTEGLEVDHLDPKEKTETIVWGRKYELLQAELAKCDTLCTSCHKLKTTIMDRKLAQHGTMSAYVKGCRCQECKTAGSTDQKERRMRIASDLFRAVHGRASVYRAGCRCDPCKDARYEEYRRRKRR